MDSEIRGPDFSPLDRNWDSPGRLDEWRSIFFVGLIDDCPTCGYLAFAYPTNFYPFGIDREYPINRELTLHRIEDHGDNCPTCDYPNGEPEPVRCPTCSH